MEKNRQTRWGAAACLAGLFLVLFLLCRLFPIVGDDWYREALGAAIHSPWDLFREVAARWSTINGRVLGNILAYTAGSRPLIRELMRAGFTLALTALLARTARLGGWRGLLLSAAALLALPRPMFCQIYPWAAGFFNYVPPVVMLLACLLILRPVFEGQPLEERPLQGVLLFLLGFGQQLFIENNTLYALWAALVLLMWYRLEQRRWSPCLLAFFAGCALGAALLFASPSYRIIGAEGGAYQSGLAGGLSGLMAAAQLNLPEVARYFILDCPVLYWSLTLLALLLWQRSERRKGRLDLLLAGGLFLECLGLAYGRLAPIAIAALWSIHLTAVLWRWTPDRSVRARTLFLWAGAFVAAGPLLFVNPIGPRCLFLSYVLLLAAAGTLLQALEPERLPAVLTGLVPAALAAAVLGGCFSVFLPLHQVELERTRILEAAAASGISEAVLPPYNHDGWLWDADNAPKMELFYGQTVPGGLTITFETQ